MTEKIQLSVKDRKAICWRSTFLQASWNFERMQNLGWAYTMVPAIKKLYTKKEDQIAALKRHMEFFNTHPYVAAPIVGVTLALEEERANGADIDDAAIQGVKIGMMGPLAGIGDPVFWFTVRPILGALGASLAVSGNILGPILFFGLKICQVVSSKTSLKVLLSSVCSSLLYLLNVGYLSASTSRFLKFHSQKVLTSSGINCQKATKVSKKPLNWLVKVCHKLQLKLLLSNKT